MLLHLFYLKPTQALFCKIHSQSHLKLQIVKNVFENVLCVKIMLCVKIEEESLWADSSSIFSNPAEAVGFLRAKKSSARLPSEGK